MYLFLTSSPCDDNVPEGYDLPCILNEKNDFVEKLMQVWHQPSNCLIISANPKAFEMNDEMADTFEKAFNYHGLKVKEMRLCDNRNARHIDELMVDCDMILLSGGHVPTENDFFQKIGLKKRIQNFKGIVMGISAGTMNCADVVYAQPEMPGESIRPDYKRFIKGLGLTKLMILPHYQMVKNYELDGRRLYEDITYEDSRGYRFYALVDGSYVLVHEGRTVIYGETYIIEDGRFAQICKEGECYEVV